MNENKQLTAEEIFADVISYYQSGDTHNAVASVEEYATLKTQQLTAENERLRKANQNLFEDCQIITEKYTDMVAENERLREVFEKLLEVRLDLYSGRFEDDPNPTDEEERELRKDWLWQAGINLTHKD